MIIFLGDWNIGDPLSIDPTFTSGDKRKSKATLEFEFREQGLQTSLDSSNKGFELMAKMGYKPGDSLGKSNTNGIVEPISIEVEKSLSHTKKKHPGLGREIDPKQAGNVIQDVKIQKEFSTKLAFILDF